MSDGPRVSVVIPSLNQAGFIRDTLQSVLCQEDIPVEVIVVDGGSTDGTLEILKEFAGRIRWESAPDRGAFEAINRGFDLAQGDVVGWLNSDDTYFSVDALKRVVSEFDARPDLDVLYGDVAVIGDDNRLLRVRRLGDYDRAHLERSNTIAQPAVFLRRRVTQQAKLRPLLSLDYEYWLRLERRGFRFHHISEILAADRQYPARASVRRHAVILDEMRAYKLELGIVPKASGFRLTLDRFSLAPNRLRGLGWIVAAAIWPKRMPRLAFPMRIDSWLRLAVRQVFRSVTEVGIAPDQRAGRQTEHG